METTKNIEPATAESVWAILRETAAQQKEFRAEYAAQQQGFQDRHEQRMAESDAAHKQQMAKIAAQIDALAAEHKAFIAQQKEANAAANKRVKEMDAVVNGTAHNNGFFAEEYFYNALNASRTFGNIKYDEVKKNMDEKTGKIRAEYDVVMLNGTSAAIIEVKYRVHQNSLEKLTTQKVSNFRAIYPKYAKLKIYLGIASMSFNDEVVKQAKLLGIGMLRPKGDSIECDTEHMKAY
jgi:hypothetical protein